jgi:hypothetical protein
MPTDLPKVTAYIDQASFDALAAASAALGTSRSRLVAELIQAAIPMLMVVTDAALVLKTRNERQREALAQAAEEMRPLGEQTEGLMDELLSIVSRMSEGPPPSNTGVTP